MTSKIRQLLYLRDWQHVIPKWACSWQAAECTSSSGSSTGELDSDVTVAFGRLRVDQFNAHGSHPKSTSMELTCLSANLGVTRLCSEVMSCFQNSPMEFPKPGSAEPCRPRCNLWIRSSETFPSGATNLAKRCRKQSAGTVVWQSKDGCCANYTRDYAACL